MGWGPKKKTTKRPLSRGAGGAGGGEGAQFVFSGAQKGDPNPWETENKITIKFMCRPGGPRQCRGF